MATILLIRHGRPDFEPPERVERASAAQALEVYRASIVTERPPTSLRETLRVHGPSLVVASDLPRALASAHLLGFDPAESDRLWAEAELPHPDRLPAALSWTVMLGLCRSAWLAGYRKNAPGRLADRQRARAGADRLVELASAHGAVALVGHGIMNRMIRRELGGRGWRIESTTGDGHWSCAALVHRRVPRLVGSSGAGG